MPRYQSPTAEFARRGFDDATASARVWERWAERLGSEPPMSLALFDRVSDRDQALEALDRFEAADPALFARIAADPDWLQRLLLVLGGSTLLAQTLTRHPAEALLLEEAPRPRGAAGWMDFFGDRVGIVDGVAEANGDALRLANRAALIEIAARDLAEVEAGAVEIVESVAEELSHVADAVLECSLAYARAEVPGWERARFAILALGKAGAQELNYISDVDVVYVVEPADGAGVDEATAIGARLAAAQARICSAHTIEGSIWQVDAGLRPEGKAGPLVRTLDSYRAYYEKWAKNWEFQAML
ncbi:MAG TPA: bifunctional glutamine-synthetase adenylyltransferase/deadenyltransferase, partial [Arachnia sp.]|nr:bifunctional glutamine-synthetase adenylyltransferase/deadenyltransferase [Arachnia sp.]